MLKKIGDFIERRQHWFGYPLIVLMSVFAFAVTIHPPDMFEQIEHKTLDQRFISRGPLPTDPRIVVLAVDDASLSKVGRWPWSRDKIATLIEKVLGEYGAAVMGFDIVFSEPQTNALHESLRLLRQSGKTPAQVASWLKSHADLGDVDARFARTLHRFRHQIVSGYFFYPLAENVPPKAAEKIASEMAYLEPSAVTLQLRGGEIRGVPVMAGIDSNLEQFDKAVDTSGYFNFFPDDDGMIRRVPLLARYGDFVYPNLDLQMLRMALGWPDLSAVIGETGVEQLILGGHPIATDESGAMLLNHYGPAKTFRHVSAADVLEGRVDKKVLENTIVLVGVTAVGVYDYRPSPFDAAFPGAEAHAASISNILNGVEIRHPDWMSVIELVGVFFLSLVCGILVYRSGAVMQSVGIFGFPLLILGIAEWLFVQYGIWMKVTYFIFGVLVTTLPVTLMRYIVEARKRAFIHEAFSHYLAPEIVDDLARNPDRLSLGGEEREMTAMFSDIENFTSFSEGMDPERLVHFLNLYLTAMSNIILEHGGTIDKYEGDAIISFFGAPVPMQDHALKCVQSALLQQLELNRLRQEWMAEGYPEIRVRIGINSGPMVVGNMGTSNHMNYTMIGDNVNLASRLEGVCKVYHTPVLISSEVFALVRDAAPCRFIDRVRVVGRAAAVDIYQPLKTEGRTTDEERALDDAYRRAWEIMQARKFTEAERMFAELAETHHDAPSAVLAERVRQLMQRPPDPDWDGVYELEMK